MNQPGPHRHETRPPPRLLIADDDPSGVSPATAVAALSSDGSHAVVLEMIEAGAMSYRRTAARTRDAPCT
jgi:hypothetical protein